MTTDNKTQSKPEKRKCKKCGSTLRAIGKDRANGMHVDHFRLMHVDSRQADAHMRDPELMHLT